MSIFPFSLMSQEVLRCFAQNAKESLAIFCTNFGRRVNDFTGKNYLSVLIGAVFLSWNYEIRFKFQDPPSSSIKLAKMDHTVLWSVIAFTLEDI